MIYNPIFSMNKRKEIFERLLEYGLYEFGVFSCPNVFLSFTFLKYSPITPTTLCNHPYLSGYPLVDEIVD